MQVLMDLCCTRCFTRNQFIDQGPREKSETPGQKKTDEAPCERNEQKIFKAYVVYSNQYATLLRGSPRFSDGSVSLVKRTWRHRLACSLSP